MRQIGVAFARLFGKETLVAKTDAIRWLLEKSDQMIQ